MKNSPKDRDSDDYLQKKAFFNQLLTVYGRKPVLEALQDSNTRVYRLHLADSNRSAAIIDEIIELAKSKNAELVYHDRKALARISRNSKQDQGVAVDLICRGYQDYRDFLASPPAHDYDIIALDRITNPQNLGMIIRSVCAGGSRALLLPDNGCAKLDALVIKASAGTLFRASILRCQDLTRALADFRQRGCRIYGLSSHAPTQLADLPGEGCNVFVLGNETEGVSAEVAAQCNQLLSIPMNNGVESLNVAVTASLLAFRKML
ncbi:MAG: RNA methyltransferase [Gammaproteobacteria bacterium]|uniref:TrmH family RNA methyltransferase n=1 Tax=Pseudomaricurvus alcaniphilus TaxID=1166482 RepID=UPI00140C1145|nr:RNA methyltransferase [Pseudomaricurvus alcaniphilus]MBR9912056.1 RNA methyltransferase [Gammaproteobacteria bacterium]NHN37466.1 RNA methyltransferase [Pseudomaricurvus alcaniphilus]